MSRCRRLSASSLRFLTARCDNHGSKVSLAPIYAWMINSRQSFAEVNNFWSSAWVARSNYRILGIIIKVCVQVGTSTKIMRKKG